MTKQTSSLSLWFQRKMNHFTTKRVRRKGGAKYLGMDLLILHTVGRHTGQNRETPLSWFPDGEDAWLIVASGGGDRHPDWFANLLAHPESTSVEVGGGDARPVTPLILEGDARDAAWQRITTAQPRYEKYQSKADREYPLIRLAAH